VFNESTNGGNKESSARLAGAKPVHKLLCNKGKKQKSSKLQASFKAKRKDLTVGMGRAYKKASVKPVSVSGSMTFPILLGYSELPRTHNPSP
jgi:hypothetical protein